MKITWKSTTEEKYWYGLEVLPPAFMNGLGFLVGEPADHRKCSVKGGFSPVYEAFAQVGDKFFVAAEDLTIAEFKTVTPASVLQECA